MNKEEKRNRIKELRERFANLSDDERTELANRGIVKTVEGRTLSGHNTVLLYLQANGVQPTVVGGYNQWIKAGRQVQKGQHAFVIFVPKGEKDEDDNIVEVERFFTANVFDITQTEPIDGEPAPVKEEPEVKEQSKAQADVMDTWQSI